MKRRPILLLFAALLLLPVAGQAQSIEPNVPLPLPRQRAGVLPFESPQDSTLGNVIARSIALALRSGVEGLGEVSFVAPRSPKERISADPDYPGTLAEARQFTLVVYGEYYIQDNAVQIRPYARIVPQSPITEQSFGLKTHLDEGTMKASPPTLQMNFPVVTVPRSVIDQWSAAFAAAATLSAQPAAGAPATGRNGVAESATFLERNGDWLRVKGDSAEGWINLPAKQNEFPAPDLLGFSRLSAKFIDGNLPDAETETGSFLSKEKERQNSMNLAFIHLLHGNIMLRRAPIGEPLARYTAIETEFKEAQRLIPGNASPVDHLAILRLMHYAPDSMKQAPGAIAPLALTEAELIEVLQEEKNPQTSDNLKTLYRRAQKQRFLKQEGMDDKNYNDEVNNRLTLVSTVDEEERARSEGRPIQVTIVMREYEDIRLNLNSIRIGAWMPKDYEKNFSFNSVTYSKTLADVKQSKTYGAEIEHRRHLSTFLFLHFTFSGWYSGYDFTRPASSQQDTLVTQASTYVLMFPVHIGLSLNLLPEFPIQPFVSAGLGGTVAASGLDYTENGKKANTADTKLQVAFSWNIAAGADFFVGKNFAFSAVVKYQYLSFSDYMYTGQKDFSGIQLLGGITWKP